jgi:DNA-binding MarR family transcriptional regulator
MVQSGAIRKVRHGVFISVNAPYAAEHEIPELQKSGGQSSSKVLALLTEPKSGPVLRDTLHVSRQRVEQILKRLVNRGDVRRFEVAGERGAFVYVRADCFRKDMLLSRVPDLHESRARILSALPPVTLCRTSDIRLITQIHSVPLQEYLDQLSAMGFVVSFKLGQKRYVGITPRGLQHPQRSWNATKASAANIVKDFGETRVRLILMLQALGQARTIDLTFRATEKLFR